MTGHTSPSDSPVGQQTDHTRADSRVDAADGTPDEAADVTGATAAKPPCVRVLFGDPETRTLETDTGCWVVSAERPDAVEAALRDAPAAVDAIDEVTTVAEDAVVVHITADDERIQTVNAFRSVTATRELYTLRGSDGTYVVTDHFRNAVAQLDVVDRDVPPTAVVDHLLFRAPIEPLTYIERIEALGQGTRLHWDVRNDERRRHQLATLDPESPPLAPDEAPAAIDETLSTVLDETEARDEEATVSTMLSGGVDSTLLHTYRGDAPTVVMELDTPELAFEHEYAEQAVDLLDVDPERVGLDESAYLDYLETSIDRLGFPSHYVQTPITDALFAQDDTTDVYVNGEGADALFGLTGSKGLRVATWLGPLVREAPNWLTDRAPASVAGRLDALQRVAEQVERRPDNPDAFAVQFPFFTDTDLVASMLGDEAVARRVRTQYEYLTARVTPATDGAFATHAAHGHLYSYLRHNTGGQWRQLAYTHGKTVSYPFRRERLARLGLSVPAERRYIQGLGDVGSLEPKYLLKSLLADRCPEFPVNQKKGSGALPVARYLDSGPLASVFERYEPPAFVPEELRAEHIDSFGPLTWNLLTYAVWRDRILENPDVEPISNAVERSWPAADDE